MATRVDGITILPDHEPGECEEEYAAGALVDEQGRPSVGALYAALARLDLGISLQGDVQLLIGAIEELGRRRGAVESELEAGESDA